MTEPKRLYLPDVCKMAELKMSTWRVYTSKGMTPKPDGLAGPSKGPFWYEDTITTWLDSRKANRYKVRDDGSRMRVNRSGYDEAAKLIESGAWVVYPEIGIVDVPHLTISNNYLVAQFIGETNILHSVMVHRLVFEWQTGKYVPIDDKLVVDHINRIRYDNRLVNLRAISNVENLINRVWSDGRA